MSTPLAALVPTITDINLLQNYLNGRTLYAHLVTTLPGIDVEVAAGCSLVTGGNYSPLELSSIQIQASANGGVDVFADPVSWIGLTNNGDAIQGVSFFIQQGATKSLSDTLFSTMAFVDSALLVSPFAPDGTNLTIPLDTVPLFRSRHDQ
jgi:hypothetical protein